MKRKKVLAVLLTAGMLTGLLAGCGGQAGSMNKGKLVKIAVCVSSQTPASMAMREVFKPRLEELTEIYQKNK